jgi:predicted HicB family RNase H-like nuclease
MTEPKKLEKDGEKLSRTRGKIHGPRVIVSLRLAPDLHDKLMQHCVEQSISANAYITGLLDANLKTRTKK